MNQPKQKIVLLGDSILDNEWYVEAGEKSVFQHLEELMGPDYEVDLQARDGAITAEVATQLQRSRTREGRRVLVLSAGGNDALSLMPLLSESCTSVEDALLRLTRQVDLWKDRYDEILEQMVLLSSRTVLLTIYNACLDHPSDREGFFFPMGEQNQAMLNNIVSIFNDFIIKRGREYGANVIDLRSFFVCPEDYANPIEPGHSGGAKLARALKDVFETL